MTPEKLRRRYRDEDARATQKEARTDPDHARRLLVTLYTLAGEDRIYDDLLSLVLKAGTMQLLVQASEADDTFALRMAGLILDGMEQMAQAAQRTPRGRRPAKKAKTA